jgi:hypothetical protein
MKAHQESIEAYPEEMEAYPREMKFVAEKSLKRVSSGNYWSTGGPILGLATSCKEPLKADETNPGQWWDPEEVGHHPNG